jgi:hypothetical protein
MAVVIFGVGPSTSASFEEQAATAMPIVESFELQRSTS